MEQKDLWESQQIYKLSLHKISPSSTHTLEYNFRVFEGFLKSIQGPKVWGPQSVAANKTVLGGTWTSNGLNFNSWVF